MFIIKGLWTALLLMFFTSIHLIFLLLTLVLKLLMILPGFFYLFMKFFAGVAIIFMVLDFSKLWTYLTGGFDHVLLFALGVGAYVAVMYLPMFISTFVLVVISEITEVFANKRNELFQIAINK